MKLRRFTFLSILGLGIIAAACTASGDNPGREYAPNMYHPVPYEPLTQITDESSGSWVSSLDDGKGEYYSSNPVNPNRMTMRVPPANTVRRGDYLPYRIPKDSLALAGRVMINPLDSSAAVVSEGKELYTKFCTHCHGDKGMGDGKVGMVYAGVPAYNSRAIKDVPGGHIFHVITQGKGRMGAHGSQISMEDRWKIVRYVQVLQNQ